jgi:regulator of sigma D
MKAFDIEGGDVKFQPEFLAVPAFKKIWDKDKSKNKHKAYSELSYVVFLCDSTISNPYRSMSESLKEEILKRDVLGKVDYKISTDLQEAIDKFRQLKETTSSRLLKSAKVAAEKLSDYFENKVNFNDLDTNGKPVYSARDLASNLGAVGKIIESLKKLEDQVLKEQLDGGTTRGGAEIGDFELPSEDIDYGEEVL